ncbi:MAG TPA: GAF and ANTAR domain-containing protein [Iamia sp.]|jgi:GAF domain-containing protein|nr:GAF and ANTAR domain-containing protein [Iamia sp.]
MAPREQLLVRAMVALADTLVDEFDIVDLTATLADRCLEILDVAATGIMLASPTGGGLRVMASSSAPVRTLEVFEAQVDEGPCPECYRTGALVVHEDLASDPDRWPTFTPRALEAGFRSAHAVPMRLRGTIIGALNLFRTEPGRLAEADIVVAQALADIATVAVLQHRVATEAQVLNQQLTHALDSRVTIEQAKGVLAEQAGIPVEDAFAVLRAHARRHRRTLVTVAEEVVSGVLDASTLLRPDPRPLDR